MSDVEDEVNPKAHKTLLQAISSLGKTQHIRKSTRDEAKKQQSEFHLLKRPQTSLLDATDLPHGAQPVGINDIVQILKTTKKHLDAGKQLKNVRSTKKVLAKPLEKPAAARIKRRVGYEGVKKKLSRWNAVVTQNRSAETQVFPLQSETVYVDTSAHSKPLQLSLKSELALAMEANEAKLKKLKRELSGHNEEDEKALELREVELLKMKLTRDELREKRKELAYLKMRESQKSAKAQKQNKIKSKKYHKLLKRQKIQEKIKEFELLQKTNPELALEKLNALEKSRVLERANLRHKNTGTWAKNLQVRAKYDKDVRKDLAEQLEISRQLTSKKNNEDDSDENEEIKEAEENDAINTQINEDPFNPWIRVGSKAVKGKVLEDEPNWRKYWLKRNQNEKLREEYEKDVEMNNENNSSDNDDKTEFGFELAAKTMKDAQKRFRKGNVVIENGWLVEQLPEVETNKNDKNIDDIFDEQEDRIKLKLQKQLKVISKKSKNITQKQRMAKLTKEQKDELQEMNDLSFKTASNRPIIDEELTHENTHDTTSIKMTEKFENVATSAVKERKPLNEEMERIDPNKIATIKLNHRVSALSGLNDAIDDDAVMDDVVEEDAAYLQQQMTISQAFEDDDIVADFTKEKTKDSELKNTEIQLSMPGWGSWAGSGISQANEANKNKRLILNLAKTEKEKRRDENKSALYVNEGVSKKLREHLVNEVPFPFTSLQDYEASIRAPVGRNFVPETAFRMLNRPAVITKQGTIIEPMDDSELIKPARKLRHVVDRRIKNISA